MTKFSVSRRTFVEGGLGLTVANFLPGTMPLASAATMEESTIAAAKSAGPAAVNGMIWSPYLVPMQPVIAEFSKQTNITIGAVQDISIFDAPQRAFVAVTEGLGMAEIKVGERIALSFDRRRIHLFDGDGRRIAGAQ
jgi:hypothetical protein